MIPANTTTATLLVTAVNDTVVDPDEFVKATLLPGPGYVVGVRTATTTIVDDEPAPFSVSISVNPATLEEDEPQSASTFTITRNGTSGALTVGYTLSGTATYNTDFSGPSLSLENGDLQGYVTFADGQASAGFSVAPIDDSTYDASETIIAGISASGLYRILGGPATVTIIDNEQPPGLPPSQLVSIMALRPTIFESQPESPVTLKITRSGNTEQALAVNYKFTGSATFAVDYAAPGAATDSITIPAGSSSVTFDVSAINDSVDDDHEAFNVSILPGNDYQVSSTSAASVTIIDNDDPALANVRVSANRMSISEANPSIPMIFTFTRDGVLSQSLTVGYRVFGDATLGADYSGPNSPGSVTFASGQSTVTVSAYAINDTVNDDNESFGLRIQPGAGYQYVFSNAGRVYIEDNDGPYYDPPQYVGISVDSDFIYEESPNSPATFTITRNVPWGDLQVRYYIGGYATLNEDYYFNPAQGGEGDFAYRTITIPSDQWSVSFQAFPIDDDHPDNFEDIYVMLADGPGYMAIGNSNPFHGYLATTTIIDNDQEPPPQPPSPITIDVDIDGSNDDGFDFPKSEDFAFEEELEENPYGIGKIVLQNHESPDVNNYTPVRVRLPRGLDPFDPSIKLRIDLTGDADDEAGRTYVWNGQKRDSSRSAIVPGDLYSLSQLRYSPADGGITIWMDGLENPSIRTLKGLEENGRPEGYLKVTVVSTPVGGPQTDGANDRVKYIIGTRKSILSEIVDNESLRLALAARHSYETVYYKADLKNIGLQLQTREQLEDLGLLSDTVDQIFNEETNTIAGLKVKIYQDFNDKPEHFVLSFAGTDTNEVNEILEDAIESITQGGGWESPQYVAARGIAQALVGANGIRTKFIITGHSLGGGLASAAAVATNIKAVTFNSSGLNRDTLMTAQEKWRYDNAAANGLVYAYTVDNDLLTAYQDDLPIPDALGVRMWLSSPFGPTMLDYAYLYLSQGASWFVPRYKILSHGSDAFLYGLLVTKDANGNVILDMMGYGL